MREIPRRRWIWACLIMIALLSWMLSAAAEAPFAVSFTVKSFDSFDGKKKIQRVSYKITDKRYHRALLFNGFKSLQKSNSFRWENGNGCLTFSYYGDDDRLLCTYYVCLTRYPEAHPKELNEIGLTIQEIIAISDVVNGYQDSASPPDAYYTGVRKIAENWSKTSTVPNIAALPASQEDALGFRIFQEISSQSKPALALYMEKSGDEVYLIYNETDKPQLSDLSPAARQFLESIYNG